MGQKLKFLKSTLTDVLAQGIRVPGMSEYTVYIASYFPLNIYRDTVKYMPSRPRCMSIEVSSVHLCVVS